MTFLPIDPYEPVVLQTPRFLRRLFTLSPSEASFARRGFSAPSREKQAHFEAVGRAFIHGYNIAVLEEDVGAVRAALAGTDRDLQGFVAEGSAMGAAMLDAFALRSPSLPRLLAEFSPDLLYLVYVGSGWAMARLRWRRARILAELDLLHKWLAYDGMGFHDAYFCTQRVLRHWRRVDGGNASRSYDQGIGRALWFVCGGSIEAAVRTLRSFPETRRGDLWSGLGLAMAYAGGATEGDFANALSATAHERRHFAQGVAFACEARSRAGHVPASAKLAAWTVTGMSAAALANVVRETRDRLPEEERDVPRYEIWRRSIADMFAPSALKGQS
jgi:hypothetical protein